MRKYRLKIQLEDAAKPQDAVGLLLPVPPDTPHQKAGALRLDPQWKVTEYPVVGSTQRTILADVGDANPRSPIEVDIELRNAAPVEAHFVPRPGSTEPGPDAVEIYESLGLAEDASEEAKLLAIIEWVAQKYNYKHGHMEGPLLTCDILTGNCLDINAATIKLMRVAGIRNAYYIGYYFPEGSSRGAWHCWLATLTSRGYECWDIAHHLKRGIREIAPGLDPAGGMRLAMSTGRDLVIELPVGSVLVSHLTLPRWVLRDGRTIECKASAEYSLLEAPQPDAALLNHA